MDVPERIAHANGCIRSTAAFSVTAALRIRMQLDAGNGWPGATRALSGRSAKNKRGVLARAATGAKRAH